METARPIRAELAEALDSELRQLDLRVAQAWCLLCAGGVVGGLGVAFAGISRSLGVVCAFASAAMLVPFGAAAFVLRRRALPRPLARALIGLEALLPWSFLALLVVTQGPAYALASWLPPMIFAGVIVAALARLQPLAPVVVGVVGAAAHLGVYAALAHPSLDPDTPLLFAKPALQVTRALSLFGTGLVASFVTRYLRRAIGRAESKVRTEELLGKYRLLEKIGAGGAGIVHAALYRPEGGFSRRVAVKILHPHLAVEPAFVEGFRREAELGARLAHPNVVTIHDFGRHEGVAFIAMELIEGLTLARLLSRAAAANVPLPIHVATHVARSALDGLEHAHEGVRGDDGAPLRILHRDVCPQNILVSKIGEVKLNDFGIARVLGAAGAAQTQNVAGHEAYMAPEQARGTEMTVRTDLFALAIVLWECLAGRRLFARATGAATLVAMLEDPIPPIAVVRPDLAASYNDFFERALARDPSARFASAREMSEALLALPGARGDAAADLGALVVRFANKEEREEEHDASTSLPTRVRGS